MGSINIINNIAALSDELVSLCREKGVRVACAESCTGGIISAAITGVPGSSDIFEAGFCTYSNRIKAAALGVDANVLRRFSEYSEQCAAEMAAGALNKANADYAVATSGVAGPAGGSSENPVGTVYIGICGKKSQKSRRFFFEKNGVTDREQRDSIRLLASEKALSELILYIKEGEK